MHVFKSYDNFEDMINEMSIISEEIKRIVSDKNGNLPTNYKDASRNIIEKTKDYLNDIYVPGKFCSFSISSYELGFKTTDSLAFGWRIEKDINDIYEYKARISLGCNHVVAQKSDVITSAKEHGYRVFKGSPKHIKNNI